MTKDKSSPLTLSPADRSQQSRIRLPLPLVLGNADYRKREAELRRMDEILAVSGIESDFIAHEVQDVVAELKKKGRELTDRHRAHVQGFAAKSLRCSIARILANESHRDFSCHLAESALLQWFCRCDTLGVVRVPAKSTLQRMESEVPAEVLTRLNRLLLESATKVDEEGESTLDLRIPVDLSMIWLDSTCAKLDIHYPADWTLLRDATRSIMAAILVIRRHGLAHRMPDPQTFVAEMNRLAMAMSGASRRGRGPNKKPERKRVLRAMKRVVRKVQEHGRRYRDLLEKDWKDSDLTIAQARRIIDRIDRLLSRLPAAIKQAHDRIIGERVIPNEGKMLSLYEPHAKVYVRGKAGADAEFGLQLLLGESAEGLIVDCLLNETVANDTTLLVPAVERIRQAHGVQAATTVIGDRGFSSAANVATLAKLGVIDATLPRSPAQMKEFLKDGGNRDLHQRRAQTEARIGVFKENFLGDQLPTKGFENQKRFVAWAVLAHNLWVMARMERAEPALAKAS